MIDRVVNALITVAVVVGIAYSLGSACAGSSQDRPDRPVAVVVPGELLLDALRVRISEADFNLECETRRGGTWLPAGCVTDGAAIVQRHAYAAQRRGTTIHAQFRAYSKRATGQRPARHARGAWVAQLSLDLSGPPPGWPSNIPWGNRTEQLEQITTEMRQLLEEALSGHPRRVCPVTVEHWGGIDCDPASRRGACDRVPSCWVRLDCGPGVNGFYDAQCPRASMSRRSRNPTLPASTARGDR